MQALIQPSLLLIARLGLFLSVTTWIVTQWWMFVVMAPASGWAIETTVDSGGYTVARWPLPCDLQIRAERRTSASSPRFATLVRTLEGVTSLPGAMWASPRDQAIGLQHWLVVSIFTSLFVAVRWICRDRPQRNAKRSDPAFRKTTQ